MSRYRSIKGRRQLNKPMTLMLTPMIDIFTILLLFLLKNYSVAEFKLTPPKDISLPTSRSEKVPELALRITVTLDGIFFEGDKIVDINDYQIDPNAIDSADNFLITPMLAKFKDRRTLSEFKMKTNDDYKFQGKVVLEADKSLPFNVVKKIMYTAERENFVLFHFATFKKEANN